MKSLFRASWRGLIGRVRGWWLHHSKVYMRPDIAMAVVDRGELDQIPLMIKHINIVALAHVLCYWFSQVTTMFKSGENPSRLVSDRSSAEHSSASYDASDAASRLQQRKAAAALIDHNNAEIFAWLKLVRSARVIEPIPERHSRHAHLSPLQIHALFALKDCPNDKILSCLELARLCRVYDHPA